MIIHRGLTIISLVPLPYGCATWNDLQDLWKCPLTSDRWASLIKVKTFFSQPLLIVLPRYYSPFYCLSPSCHLLMWKATLCSDPKGYGSNTPYWFFFTRGNGTFFDTLATCVGVIKNVVHSTLRDLPYHFMECQRSSASSPSLPRLRLHLVLILLEAICDLDLADVLLDLRRNINSPFTAIAQDNVLDNGPF